MELPFIGFKGCNTKKRKTPENNKPKIALPFLGFEGKSAVANGVEQPAAKVEATHTIQELEKEGYDFNAEVEKFVEPFVPAITAKEYKRIEEAPQHLVVTNGVDSTNPVWQEARALRATGSIIATAMGLNPYESKESLTRKKVWPQPWVPVPACTWGNEKEDEAMKCLKEWFAANVGQSRPDGKVLKSFEVKEFGLCVCQDPGMSWAAMSPDGLVWETFEDGTTEVSLIEIKCPWRYSPLNSRGRRPGAHFYPMKLQPDGSGPHPLPPYYWTQLIWGMNLLNPMNGGVPIPKCYFVVWAPVGKGGRIQLTEVPNNTDYFATTMKPALWEWWRHKFVPAMVMKQAGLLDEGEVNLPVEVDM